MSISLGHLYVILITSTLMCDCMITNRVELIKTLEGY